VDGTPIALSEGQYIIPVKVNTARPDGDVLHQVQPGQSLWSIAIFYHTTIDQIRRLNNMGTDNTVYQGQKLLVKKGATQPVPTATITPTTAISATPWPTLPLKVTPSLVSTAAPSENSGNITTIVGVLFVAFIILAGVIGSSLKMKA
jgi:LysM repeat protein